MATSNQTQVTRITRRGNSLTVRIPAKVIDSLAWNEGDMLNITVVRGHAVMTRVKMPSVGDLIDMERGTGTEG